MLYFINVRNSSYFKIILKILFATYTKTKGDLLPHESDFPAYDIGFEVYFKLSYYFMIQFMLTIRQSLHFLKINYLRCPQLIYNIIVENGISMFTQVFKHGIFRLWIKQRFCKSCLCLRARVFWHHINYNNPLGKTQSK